MIEIDRERCVGAGMCVLTAPQVFDQSDADGRVMVLDRSAAAERSKTVENAVALCPSQALSIRRRGRPSWS